MKKKVEENKKGYTLVEVILSVALIALLLVPISGLIATSFKSSKKADVKQEGAIIGQQLLEELKSYDTFVGATPNPINLLDGSQLNLLVATANGGEYTKVVTDGNQRYTVNVELEKNTNFRDYSVATDTAASYDTEESNNNYETIIRFRTTNTGENEVKIGDESTLWKTIPYYTNPQTGLQERQLLLDLSNENTNIMRLKLQDYWGNTYHSYGRDEFIENKPVTYDTNEIPKIKIFLENNDNYNGDVNSINLIINNNFSCNGNDDPQVIFDVVKKKDYKVKVNFSSAEVNTTLGNINVQIGNNSPQIVGSKKFELRQNITSDNNIEPIGDMYNIKVTVDNNGEEIFKSEINNNINN